MPRARAGAKSTSNRSPIDRQTSGRRSRSRRASSKGSVSGFDFSVLSRPTTALKVSLTPRAFRLFSTTRRGLLLTSARAKCRDRMRRVSSRRSSAGSQAPGSQILLAPANARRYIESQLRGQIAERGRSQTRPPPFGAHYFDPFLRRPRLHRAPDRDIPRGLLPDTSHRPDSYTAYYRGRTRCPRRVADPPAGG